ncbi:MAG: hypothetical protein ACK4L7_09790, partial [Flavobacteriales bacterium]
MNRHHSRAIWRPSLFAIATACCLHAAAQHSITTLGATYAQDFDGMGTAATASMPAHWRANNTAASTATDWALLGTTTTQAYGTTGAG